MAVRVWMAIDAVIFAMAVVLLAVVGPSTIWAFVPDQSALPLMWVDMLLFTVGVGLLYELVGYVREYGID